MEHISKRWGTIEISERVAIAQEAGLPGKTGSSDWSSLPGSAKEMLEAYDEKETKGIKKVIKGLAQKLEANPRSVAKVTEEAKILRPEVRKLVKDTKGVKVMESVKGTVGKPKKVTGKIPQDYLLWVGTGSYPSIGSFVEESKVMGVSRRISKVPTDLVLGESKVFLAHDEGETGDAVVFGYFVPTIIEVIVMDNDSSIPDRAGDKATPVTIEQASKEDERGCGFREDSGAIYLISTDMVRIPNKDYNVIIDKDGQRFRGIKKVEGNKILYDKRSKADPSSLHKPKIKMKKRPEAGDAWSNEERSILEGLLKKINPQRAARNMSKINGRSLYSVEYQMHKMRKANGINSGGEGEVE
jgi:hypothetical protein